MTKKASQPAEMKNKINFPAGIKPKKVTQGRKKIKIEKIANVNNRQVTFSKRRTGLFKKAAEICILTGARVALIVESSGKRVYTFGYPDIDSVLAGYQSGYEIPAQPWSEAELYQMKLHNDEYNRLCLELEAEKKKLAAVENADNGSGLGSEIPWFEKPLDGMSLEELYEILTPLEELQKNVQNSLNDGHTSQPLAITNNINVDHADFSQPLTLMNNTDDHQDFGQSLALTNNVDHHDFGQHLDYFSQHMDDMNNVNVGSSQPLTLTYNVDSSQSEIVNTSGITSGVQTGDGGVDDNETFDFFPNGDYYEF